MDVIGVGALNIDFLYKVDEILPSEGEIFIKEFSMSFGGSAANTIVGLSRLGKKVGMVGCVGNDREGKEMLEDFKKERVDISEIDITNHRTGYALCFIDRDGKRAIYVYAGANDKVKLEKKIGYLNKAKFVHFSSFIGKYPFNEQKKLINRLKVKLSFSPGSIYARKGLDSILPIIQRSYVVFLNREEIKRLTGKGYVEGAKKMLELGASIVAVTLGREGCYIASKQGCFRVEGFSADVVDTTGAGDAFAAGFLYGLLEGKDLYSCGRIGNWVASLCIREIGARKGLPSKEMLEEFL